jgi:hypothetical protein
VKKKNNNNIKEMMRFQKSGCGGAKEYTNKLERERERGTHI